MTFINDIDILRQWAFAGLAIGVTMLFKLLTTEWRTNELGISDTTSSMKWRRRFHDPKWWMHAALPLYMIHQFEEHGIDLFGRHYSFQTALCEALGETDIDRCPATALAIFFVNVGTVWIGGLLARKDVLGAGLNFYGTMAINAVVHIMPFILRGFLYNPGLFTAAVMFLPAAYLAARSMLQSGRCSGSDLLRALVVGVVIHVVIIASFVAARNGYASERLVCFMQLMNVLPLLII